ncbi:MAG: hypothetical protein ACHQJ6_04625 [Candidatus Berkiellales bacterium]
MFKAVTNLFTHVILRMIVNVCGAMKSYFTGQNTANTAAKEFSGAMLKDSAIELGKMAVREVLTRTIPGFKFADTTVQSVASAATNGIQGALSGESMPKNIIKSGLAGVNSVVAGPLLAIPLTMATDYVVDKAADIHRVGLTTAYNNYKNGKDYELLPYCEQPGSELKAELADNDLGMSFIHLNRAACAA